ncbi:MAG: sugar transferase [Microbacterium sp.]|uniref:sugar transferase n=1 Tax=Microbacterium sp. TaxID=51671 RepID=UPI0039E4E4DA
MTSVDDAVSASTFTSAPAAASTTASPGAFAPIAAPRTDETPVVPGTQVAPRVTPTLERRQMWERRYRRRLRLTDTLIVAASTVVTAVVQHQVLEPAVLAADPWILARIPVLAAATWLLVLALFSTRDARLMGAGTREYKRVAHATGLAFGILAIAFVVFQWQGIRMQLIIALPVGLIGLLFGRWASRRWLLRQRKFGHYVSRAIVVGRSADVEHAIRTLHLDAANGYVVVGATLDDDHTGEIVVDGQPFATVGSLNTVAQSANELGADAIIVASQPDNDPDFVKRLSWQLEGTAAELVLSSRLVDVAGPRISLRQVEGLPLINVKIPTYEGGQHLLKRALDILVATIALISIGLLFPFIALAIKLDSRGPVFFRQERVGRDGRRFRMVKFRSMKTNAEQELAALLEENEGSGPLFKMKHDPRVTRVGRFLRKTSLDELPQFWNVLVGDMSVVGPRPPLPSEVTAYDGTVFRRLYINPGITGLWQVSGRSDLSWEESVRLDLRYVENWSVMSDLQIMWRTAKVMVRPNGAY